jgi:hypothetical protein
MIVDDPSDALLASADAIALFDPRWASFREVIVAAPSQPRCGAVDCDDKSGLYYRGFNGLSLKPTISN